MKSVAKITQMTINSKNKYMRKSWFHKKSSQNQRENKNKKQYRKEIGEWKAGKTLSQKGNQSK